MTDFAEVDVINFEDLPWRQPAMQRILAEEGFGGRGKANCVLKGRGPFLVKCRTGKKPEQMIGLKVQVNSNAYGPSLVAPVFSDDLSATEGLNYGNLFLSDDGTDQWPPRGFDGQLHPRENASLKANTDYFFMIPAFEGGHPSVKPSITISYTSMMTDDVDVILRKIPMTLELDGELVDGVWVENA
jgi:hypothetical protein